MKTKIVFVLSSFLLALSLMACSGSSTPGTSGRSMPLFLTQAE